MNKPEYLEDVDGDMIPVSMIDPNDLNRHELVELLIGEAKAACEMLSRFKESALEKLCNYLDEIADQFGENWKGNATIWNYNRTGCIEMSVAKQIQFDEKLQIAKNKIYKCIDRWSDGASENIVLLIKKAFDTEKSGFVDTKRVLQLTTLKIDDAEWKEAMSIIRNSIVTTGTKKYVNFKAKTDDTKSIKPIILNFSAL